MRWSAALMRPQVGDYGTVQGLGRRPSPGIRWVTDGSGISTRNLLMLDPDTGHVLAHEQALTVHAAKLGVPRPRPWLHRLLPVDGPNALTPVGNRRPSSRFRSDCAASRSRWSNGRTPPARTSRSIRGGCARRCWPRPGKVPRPARRPPSSILFVRECGRRWPLSALWHPVRGARSPERYLPVGLATREFCVRPGQDAAGELGCWSPPARRGRHRAVPPGHRAAQCP